MVQSAARSTTYCDTVLTAAGLHGARLAFMPIVTEKHFSIGVEGFHLLRTRKEGLGFFEMPKAQRIIDDSILFRHAAGVQHVLEGHRILLNVPEAPFHIAKQVERTTLIPRRQP